MISIADTKKHLMDLNKVKLMKYKKGRYCIKVDCFAGKNVDNANILAT